MATAANNNMPVANALNLRIAFSFHVVPRPVVARQSAERFFDAVPITSGLRSE